MDLTFRTQRLRRAFEDPPRATRLWGPTVGPQYVQRLARVMVEPTWQDLFRVRSLNLHPLRGDRRGDFAIRLTGRWRIIVRPGSERSQINIIDVEDYHA